MTGQKRAAEKKKRNVGSFPSFILSPLISYQPSGYSITLDPIFLRTVSLSSLCLCQSISSSNLAAGSRLPLCFYCTSKLDDTGAIKFPPCSHILKHVMILIMTFLIIMMSNSSRFSYWYEQKHKWHTWMQRQGGSTR